MSKKTPVPKTMPCGRCGELAHPAKDSLCRNCRLAVHNNNPTRYHWTPALDAQLRTVYSKARTKTELSVGLKDLARRTGFPGFNVGQRVQKLGLYLYRTRPWGEEDDLLLRNMAGSLSIRTIAKRIGRSPDSVRQRIHRNGLIGSVTEGYSARQLGELMGIHHRNIAAWMARGWLRRDENGRIPEAAVETFIQRHLDVVPFRNVDEAWLKGMINPGFASARLGSDETEMRGEEDRYTARALQEARYSDGH